MRALQNGRITPDDFKSFDEKVADFTGNGSSRSYGYTAPSAGASDYYYAPPQSNDQSVAGSYYYTAQSAEDNNTQQETAENAFEEQVNKTDSESPSEEN